MNEQVAALLTTLPRRLKVGAYTWRVVLMEEDEGKCGEADFEHHRINLWPSAIVDGPHLVGILLHECFHIVYDNEDLERASKADDPEEVIVVGFEQGMVSLFRDNPKLLTWIKRGLK